MGQVATLACKEFPRWRLDAGQVQLFLVAKAGAPKPLLLAPEAFKDLVPLAEEATLGSAGVTSGAWLVAVPSAGVQTAAALPLADAVARFAAFHDKPLDERQRHALRFSPAFAEDRAALREGEFNSRSVVKLLLRLRNVVASSTRLRLVSTTGIVLDGPVSGAMGQASTSILIAYLDGLAMCAKVGTHAALSWEWHVSQTIHARSAAPAVMKAIHFDAVPSEYGQALLLMPLYPMTAAEASLAMTPEHSIEPQRQRCRDTLAALVAMCGLAGIAVFARAGLAHGDIKPGNIMLTGVGAAGVAPCVLIDFGAAKPTGQSLAEFSAYGLEHAPVATLAYDLACLASTLALVQYDLPLALGSGTGAALLTALQEQDGAAWQPAEAPRPPGSLAAELCLLLSYRARDSSAGLDLRELRVAAEAVADAASEAGLRVPSVATIWGSGGEE